MNNLRLLCMSFALSGLVASDSLLARGGHGGGHHIGSGGFRHFGGGHHFRGGHHHGHHFGGRHVHHFGLGLGYFYPGYYGYRRPYYRYPYYGYPYYGRQAAPSVPVTYIQREEIKASRPQNNYWHYCRNPEGYYPYVKQCPEGWLQVAPHPSTQ
ncbi:conserved hypothetical protein [Nitrosomonas nitrosa]|uniref:Proline-rich region n=1 Tax=Nitrosomonas nitrosa TaxID=52442 RepID=A0A8H8Z077_9PROT|nr:hypothetical protein [Nitrosomonas nitrosa]CAE6497523.1 conserved hypothetical protein [Nitrosomonas nitrosa]